VPQTEASPRQHCCTRSQSSTTLLHTLRLGRGWGLLLAILLVHCLIVPVHSVAAMATTPAGMSAVQAARVTEVSVGITEYATEHAGFRGTLKYRCADFIVREVSLDRRVVKLTSTKATAEMPAAAPSTDAPLAEPALEGAARTDALAALIGQEQVRSFHPARAALEHPTADHWTRSLASETRRVLCLSQTNTLLRAAKPAARSVF